MVNFGVFFLQRNDTEKTAKPIADNNPNIKPIIDPLEKVSTLNIDYDLKIK